MSETSLAIKYCQEKYYTYRCSERPEGPGPDADAAEIAEWMKEDFG
jgi:hypothetical protein